MKNGAARIHLLAANNAPVVIIIRRKPSRWFHILRWNTQTDQIESGSWFEGRIYPFRCDVSFDGRFMVYFAMGSDARSTWTGVCEPPFLHTVAEWRQPSTYDGGGIFWEKNLLFVNPVLNKVGSGHESLPFATEHFPIGHVSGDQMLYCRMERDGYQLNRPFGKEKDKMLDPDDPEWTMRPTNQHPWLRMKYRQRSSLGTSFVFDLPDYPNLLDHQVTWATYDSLGQLLIAREGVLYRYRLKDFETGIPSAMIDLEPIGRTK
jgi:hypothetical protein